MDSIDRQIIALLRINARQSFREIGERVGLSAPAVKRRVDRLEQSGAITGYGATVNPEALGWPIRAIVALFCEGRMSADEVGALAAGVPEVMAAYTIAGEGSAILHVLAADPKHLEHVLARLREAPGVLRTQTQVVLSTLFERPLELPTSADHGRPAGE